MTKEKTGDASLEQERIVGCRREIKCSRARCLRSSRQTVKNESGEGQGESFGGEDGMSEPRQQE